MVYAEVVDDTAPRLEFRYYHLLDLDVFRQDRHHHEGERIHNKDGSAGRAFKIASWPREILVRSTEVVEFKPVQRDLL